MKKLTYLLALLATTLFLNACGGDSSPSSEPSIANNPAKNSQNKIEIPNTENTKPIVSQNGGQTKISFTTTGYWTSSSSDTWCSISPASGQSGQNTITITVNENDTYDDRVAIITLQSGTTTQTITISQVQKDAIVLALKEHEIEYNTKSVDFEIQTNVDIHVSISDEAKAWISQANTRALQSISLHFDIAENDGTEERSGTITIEGGNASQKVTIKQNFDFLAKERKALIDLYNATDGNNWFHNDNWGSDKPLNEWYGVSVDEKGHVFFLRLRENNLNGYIPESIGNLSYLYYMHLMSNHLSGEIPSSICNIHELEDLGLYRNDLTGSIPNNIGNLVNLTSLSLWDNNLSGALPESLGNIIKLEYIDIQRNHFEGEIPRSIGNLINLKEIWMGSNNFSGDIPESIGNLINLEILSLGNNELTGSIPKSLSNIKK